MIIVIYVFIGVLSLIFSLVYKRLPVKDRLRLTRKLGNERVMADLKKINPADDVIKSCLGFFDKRLTRAAIIIAAGSVLVTALEARNLNDHELIEGNLIKRNDYKGGDKNVRLQVRLDQSEDRERVDVTVSDKKYSYDDLILMAAEADEILSSLMLADNASLDEVTKDLSFPSSIEDYPFKITWRTSDPLLLSTKGLISRDRFKKLSKDRDVYEGIPVSIHYELIYEDFVQESDLAARLYPGNKDNEMTLSEYVGELIGESDKEGREDDYLKLPDSLNGSILIYEEVWDKSSLLLLMLVIVTSVFVYCMDREDLKDKVKDREKELISDYPRMVNKFLLFYSAGLTTRGIVSKLCKEYQISLEKGGPKRYMYEELLICEGHMNEGMGEISAYEGFAAGCGIHKYRHFVSLVSQAIGKGRSDLISQLEREASDAFQDRKNRARELGEEAGTKLLFPMIMMLLTVLIIVMVPAFISFRF